MSPPLCVQALCSNTKEQKSFKCSTWHVSQAAHCVCIILNSPKGTSQAAACMSLQHACTIHMQRGTPKNAQSEKASTYCWHTLVALLNIRDHSKFPYSKTKLAVLQHEHATSVSSSNVTKMLPSFVHCAHINALLPPAPHTVLPPNHLVGHSSDVSWCHIVHPKVPL